MNAKCRQPLCDFNKEALGRYMCLGFAVFRDFSICVIHVYEHMLSSGMGVCRTMLNAADCRIGHSMQHDDVASLCFLCGMNSIWCRWMLIRISGSHNGSRHHLVNASNVTLNVYVSGCKNHMQQMTPCYLLHRLVLASKHQHLLLSLCRRSRSKQTAQRSGWPCTDTVTEIILKRLVAIVRH